MHKRPLSVTVLGWLYIAMGAIGGVLHLAELRSGAGFQTDVLWIELVQVAAIACGAYLLRAQNWARWAAVAWMGFHVIVSLFHSRLELLIHCLFFAAIAFVLFRSEAAQYFRERTAGL